ncbi:MAG TPA: glycerophosphodiester phosphodiesterase family protein [Methylomirabilota bacterium]|nr:glycerophosphodiester phosphodiesterase family protein [Methylomirabilota bacterium]
MRQCPLIVAHRGGAGLWPENSLFAFQRAIGLHVDFVECDVHLTKDDVPVIIHDPMLERTTTGRGAVRDLTVDDLQGTVRLKDRDGSLMEPGKTVPSLLELALMTRYTGVGLVVEIKTDSRYARYPGIEEKVLEDLRQMELIRLSRIVSFDLETIRRVRDLDQTAQTGGLFSRMGLARMGWTLSEALERLAPLDCALAGLEFPLVDQRAVGECRRLGLGTAAWTVNDPAEMKRLADLGIDILITDRPDLAQTLLNTP